MRKNANLMHVGDLKKKVKSKEKPTQNSVTKCH